MHTGLTWAKAASPCDCNARMCLCCQSNWMPAGAEFDSRHNFTCARNPRVEIAAGKVVDQVQITPQMCHGWLKLIPRPTGRCRRGSGHLFARANRGSVSRWRNQRLSKIAGNLEIHAAQVGPGPTSRQLLTLIQQIKSLAQATSSNNQASHDDWIIVPKQRVPFEMAGGRVAHENLTMIVGGVPVQTSGWVAMDERMSLIAKIPIQDEWIGTNRWLSTLKGQTIDVPISGSLQQPRLDRRVLNNLTNKTITNGAEELLQQEVQKQLNRLFDR